MKKFLTTLLILLFVVWSAAFFTGLYWNSPPPLTPAKPEKIVIFVPYGNTPGAAPVLERGGKTAVVSYGHLHTITKDPYMNGTAVHRMLMVPEGKIENLALDLRAVQAIRSPLFLSMLARLYDSEKRIRPGYYLIAPTDGTLAILSKLTLPPYPSRP